MEAEVQGDFFGQRIDQHIEAMAAVRADARLMEALPVAGDMMASCLRAGGTVLLCGNGGSAADCQHIAAEFVGRFLSERRALPAESLTTNTSSLTAIANDYGFEDVFLRQVEARGRKGDVLVGISTSGGSVNVIRAMERARQLGLGTIGMTGGAEGAGIEGVSDALIAVPSKSTPSVQEAHILIGHMLCEHVEKSLAGWL